MGSENIDVSDWKNLRRRVSSEYQEKICSYFSLDKSHIFSEIKTFEIPKMYIGAGINRRECLIRKGYRYATHLKNIMYEGGISITDLAIRLNKQRVSISRWISGIRMVSPEDQQRIANILQVPSHRIFTTNIK